MIVRLVTLITIVITSAASSRAPIASSVIALHHRTLGHVYPVGRPADVIACMTFRRVGRRDAYVHRCRSP